MHTFNICICYIPAPQLHRHSLQRVVRTRSPKTCTPAFSLPNMWWNFRIGGSTTDIPSCKLMLHGNQHSP